MEDIKGLLVNYLESTKEQIIFNKVIQELKELNILIKDFGYGSYSTFIEIYGKYNPAWWKDFVDEFDEESDEELDEEEVLLYHRII
jgi:hypothetical protein